MKKPKLWQNTAGKKINNNNNSVKDIIIVVVLVVYVLLFFPWVLLSKSPLKSKGSSSSSPA
jgi:hypothetical protein